MFSRALRLPRPGTETFFLWGPRQAGKTTLLRDAYPEAYWVDLLKSDEFRRYVRIPVITEVALVAGQKHFSASSLELSSGGMSLKATEDVTSGLPVEISFALLTLPRIWIRGNVSWTKPGQRLFGVRFDPRDDRKARIKEWVDGYLES